MTDTEKEVVEGYAIMALKAANLNPEDFITVREALKRALKFYTPEDAQKALAEHEALITIYRKRG